MQQQKSIIRITAVLIVLLLLIAALVWGMFSDWFKTPFQHIYLTVGGKRLQSNTVYVLGNVKFGVHQFGRQVGFTVKILPTGDDFVYTVDGELYSFRSEIVELTKGFEVKKYENSFLLRGKHRTMKEVLQAYYPGKTVTVPNGVDEEAHYALVVISGNDEYSTPMVTFRIDFAIEDIELSPGHLYF